MAHRSATTLAATLALAMSPVVLCLAGGSPARAAETATVQEILDGNELYIDQKQARVNARASAPQLSLIHI